MTYFLGGMTVFKFFVLGFVFGIASASSNKRVKMNEFFSDESLTTDLTQVTWAHAVNSQAQLKAALEGPAMMLEADILMGHEGDGSEFIPVMAHPPATKSDLSFEEFLDQVLHAASNDHKKKGIKLDFKDIEAVLPVLKQLKAIRKQISFPVWINADVLRGPVNSTRKPLDAVEFLKFAAKYTPFATLSIGWTTRFGNDDIIKGSSDVSITIGKYEEKHINEMLQLISSSTDSISSTDRHSIEISFPVRAAIAVQSTDEIVDLLGKVGPLASITLWSPVDEPVDHQKVRDFIDAVGKSRCYVDLPFSVYSDQTSSTTVLPGKFNDENSRAAGNSSDDHANNSGTSLKIVSFALVSTLVLMIL